MVWRFWHALNTRAHRRAKGKAGSTRWPTAYTARAVERRREREGGRRLDDLVRPPLGEGSASVRSRRLFRK